MALTVNVTKVSVSQSQPGRNLITLHLNCQDVAVSVIDQDFQVEYSAGENVATKIAAVGTQMQAAIDKYKAEQVIFNSTQLNNAVTTLKNGLVG